MKPNPGPGKFIVLEGLDGAGTTTQSRLLGEELAARGPVWVTWEPTDRPAGLLIRRILAGELVTDPRALALLFAADRLDHVYGPEGIAAHLRRGENVVCDRYYLSSLAYQTLDAGFSWVHALNSRAMRPDLTLFLEVPVLACLERIGSRQGERKELFEREEALARVRASYYRAMRCLGKRETIQVVDGCAAVFAVAEMLRARVQALFDPTLLTEPCAQFLLARQEGALFLPIFRRLLQEQEGLSLRGVRRGSSGLEVEVDTPGSLAPLRVQFPWPGEGVTVAVPAAERDGNRLAALLERLARQALQEAGGG
jgi:dTMP kinase